MVNCNKNLAALGSFAEELSGQRSFRKVYTGMHILPNKLVAPAGWLLETATPGATQEKLAGDLN